jgi:pimeloyl-ACP methyl ester carboxylesterase
MEQVNETALALFSSKYHVFLYDHRGMGESDRGHDTPTLPLYAHDAAELIAALGYQRMHIYGTSMGSFIAQELALTYPERVQN